MCLLILFFKQKTAYEMRISDLSSDVCSSDLRPPPLLVQRVTRSSASQSVSRCAACPSSLSTNEQPSNTSSSCPPMRLRKINGNFVSATRLRKTRSEERRVGNECVRKCKSGWSSRH